MKIIAALINYILPVMFVMTVLSCQHSPDEVTKDVHAGQMFVETKAFQTGSGWGYSIYVNDTLYIKQSFIPGLHGRHSFASRGDAIKTGELAIKKMATTHKMPIISQEDLRRLNIQLHVKELSGIK